MANPLEVELVWKKKEYKEVMTALTKMSVAAAEATQAIRELHAEIDAGKKRYGMLWPVLLFFARMKRGEK